MYALPSYQSRLNVLATPSFLIVDGVARYIMGGYTGRLHVGEVCQYRKHGLFRLEYAGESYGIIHHETRTGRVLKIFIPPERRMYASNGMWEYMDVNYASWHKYAHTL